MSALNPYARMSLVLDISWSSGQVSHLDRFFINKLNPWRDLFPGSFLEQALEKAGGSPLDLEVLPGGLVPDHDKRQIHHLDRTRLNDLVPFGAFQPGRFYPRGVATGIPGIFRGNMTPFYCAEKSENGIVADFNHALAGIPLKVRLGSPVLHEEGCERGGSCTDWMDLALTGPGMQRTRGQDAPDFFSGSPFERKDPSPDPGFYQADRFVHHIDDEARRNLSCWYGGLLTPGDRILDLMAGWDSHLPDNGGFSQVHGLGLNANEMAANPCLTGFTVQDLNQNPDLDFEDHAFDAVVCSLSVEYLIRPLAVFREVARVLRPGGILAVSFSNRWFPEKAIQLWTGLHEFERMGFVLDCLKQTGRFRQQSTYSLRGCPRPVTDRHYPGLRYADPVYGVTGIALG